MKVHHFKKFAHSHSEVMLHFTSSIYALTKMIIRTKCIFFPLSISVYIEGETQKLSLLFCKTLC
jgi:hypothetical protein